MILSHKKDRQIFLVDRELFYFVLNRETDGTNVFGVTVTVVIGVGEVEAGPENPGLFCASVQTVSHAVAVYNINRVVVRVLLRMCEYFVDGSEGVRLPVVLEIGRVRVYCVIALPI